MHEAGPKIRGLNYARPQRGRLFSSSSRKRPIVAAAAALIASLGLFLIFFTSHAAWFEIFRDTRQYPEGHDWLGYGLFEFLGAMLFMAGSIAFHDAIWRR
jgi:hypothetical protein